MAVYFLVLVAGLSGLIAILLQNNPTRLVFVEQQNYTCPAFCKNDIIEYERRDVENDRLSVGDYVVMDYGKTPPYVSRILVDSRQWEGACPEDDSNWLAPPRTGPPCPGKEIGEIYDFLIPGGPDPDIKTRFGQEYSLIENGSVQDFRPRKIGNLHDYYILSDGITEFVGRALLGLYKLTGVNLFGLS